MAVPELSPDEIAHLRPLLKAEADRIGSINKLAFALEISGTALGNIINRDGGASKATARRFAKLIGSTYEAVVGHAPVARPGVTPRGYRPTPEAVRKARVFLRQPPQSLTDDAIDLAVEETLLDSPEDAARPGAVAEALRHTILGSVAHWPPATAQALAAPAGTRRSRNRAR